LHDPLASQPESLRQQINRALRQTRDGAAEAARQVAGLYHARCLPGLDGLDAQARQAAADQVRLLLTLGGGWQ